MKNTLKAWIHPSLIFAKKYISKYEKRQKRQHATLQNGVDRQRNWPQIFLTKTHSLRRKLSETEKIRKKQTPRITHNTRWMSVKRARGSFRKIRIRTTFGRLFFRALVHARRNMAAVHFFVRFYILCGWVLIGFFGVKVSSGSDYWSVLNACVACLFFSRGSECFINISWPFFWIFKSSFVWTYVLLILIVMNVFLN